MFDTSFKGADSFSDRELRVLLSVASPRDRELLAEQLQSAELSVVTPDDDGTISQFDLCIVDKKTYPSVAATIEQRREEIGAVDLPVLLVLNGTDSERDVRPYWDSIDDVLSVPTSSEVFRHRIDGLVNRRRQSEQLALFVRAMDDAQTGISIADADGDQEMVYVNDAFLEITGYDRDEVLGRNCRFLQGPETRDEPVRELRRAVDAREATSVRLRNYRKDGEMWWNDLKIAPVYGTDGVTHFVGFQEDVTERVEQTRALRRHEEIVTAAGDPIYALDGDLQFTLLNEATAAFSHGSKDELLGRHVETVFGEDHAEVLAAAVSNLVETDTEQRTIGTVIENLAGQSRRFQTTVSLLPAAESAGVVCVSRDITEDKERESRLSVLDRVLRHNLRNKLMVIQAQVDQVRWHSDSHSIADSADTIEQTTAELLDLAETAREFKRTVDPAEDDTVGPVDIGTHLCHAVRETGVEYERVTILADVPKPLWATAHDSFELAMTELLDLAVTASEEVTIRVSLTADREEGDAHITVRHDGSTLEDVELEALNAGIESDLRHTQGLGLWFVRWMAINSGGRFSISNADGGTRVELTLPLADPPE